MDKRLVPKSINVLGKDIDIVVAELDSLHGQFDGNTMTIYLSVAQPDEAAHRTLYHEVIHAALFISGMKFLLTDDLEEAIVRALEHGMADLVYFRSDKKRGKKK